MTIAEQEDGDKIRWGTIIPLIGGSAIGCKEATGTLPAFHLSYTPFAGNEKHIRNYWPSVPMHYLDEQNADKRLPSFQDVDFINSVCPCAGLSMLNTASSGGKKRGEDAAANQWMYESSVYVLSKVRPKVLWGENAPGLFTAMGRGVVEKLRKIGEHFGYSFSVMKTSTDLHGIPQARMRTFYFFWKSPTVPKMDYYNRKRKNLMEYLKEIPKNASMQNIYGAEGKASERSRFYQFVLEKEGLTHAEFVKKTGKGTVTTYLERNNLLDECIQWLNEKYKGESFWTKTGNNRTHVQYLEHVKRKREKGLGYWDDSPRFVGDTFAAVMKKTMMWAVHPEEDRFLNAREFAHLMGLPHDFEIDGEKSLNHIAQNVPTCTARDMAEQVKKFIRGELQMTKFSFIKQDNITQTVVGAEEGFVPPVTEDQLNDVERNKMLLESLSQSLVPVAEVKVEKKERKQRVKTEPSEAEKALLFIEAEIRREKKEQIKEEKKALREKEKLLEKERKLEMRREKDSERLERLRQRQMLKEQERQLRIEERGLSLASRPARVPLNPEEVEEEQRKFMCYICKIFPRDDSRNKSELYRHYSIKHFSKQLKKYLPEKGKAPCSLCPDGKLINSQAYSHVGQTHGKVEEFLPEEHHITGFKRRSSWIQTSLYNNNNEVKPNDIPKTIEEIEREIEEVEDIISDDEEEEEIQISSVKTRSGRMSKPTVIRSNGIRISKVKPDPVMLIVSDDEKEDDELRISKTKRKRYPPPTQRESKRTRFMRSLMI